MSPSRSLCKQTSMPHLPRKAAPPTFGGACVQGPEVHRNLQSSTEAGEGSAGAGTHCPRPVRFRMVPPLLTSQTAGTRAQVFQKCPWGTQGCEMQLS